MSQCTGTCFLAGLPVVNPPDLYFSFVGMLSFLVL